jgi:predicted O-methyltransferase YrrM
VRDRARDVFYTRYGKMFPESPLYRDYLRYKEHESKVEDIPFGGAYPWDYLKPENNDRSAILNSIVGPYIEEKESVFDICCGFSPLAQCVLAKQCELVGVDISAEAITYCQQSYPRGTFYVADDAAAVIPGQVDVLIHLGITPGTDRWGVESRTEVGTSMRAIRQTRPRVVFLEAAVEFDGGYRKLKALVEKLDAYDLEKEVSYELLGSSSVNPSGASQARRRKLSIYRRRSLPRFSLSEDMLARVFAEMAPSYQAESFSDLNLGFGFLYYAMGRIVRPKLSIVLGSQRGFSAICIALAMRDNANGGKLILVDAGYDDKTDGPDRGHGGIGFWRDPDEVGRLLDRFEVRDVMEVRVLRTSEFAALYEKQKMPPVELLMIDADHSFEGFKYDFERYSQFLRSGGLILCHDTEVEEGYASRPFGVGRYLKEVMQQNPEYEAVSLPVWPGVGIVRKCGRSAKAGTEQRNAA